jgi:hypothetical protein
MPSKLAKKNRKRLSSDHKRALMKKIFEEHFGVNVFSNSYLDNFITKQFRPGQRNNKFNEIIEQYNTDSEPMALAQSIALAIDELCDENIDDDQEILQIADFLQSKLLPLITILNADNQLNQRTGALNEFIDKTIDSLIAKGIPSDCLEIKRLTNIQHNLKNIVEFEIAGQLAQASGQLLKMHDLVSFGSIIRKIAPNVIMITSEKSSPDDAIQAAFISLYHIGEGLKQPKIERLGKVLRNAHWLTILDLHKASCNQSLDYVLNSLELNLGQNTIYSLKQALEHNGISEEQAAEIFALVKQSPHNNQLINDTRQTQKFAAASALVCDIARQIKSAELEKVALAALCVSGVRQFYVELALMDNSNAKLVSLSQSTGVILASCGELTKNRTMATIGQGILAGVSAYQLALSVIPGGAVVALPMAALSVVSSFISNRNSRKQQQRELARRQTEQQILNYVKQSHACIIALHNATNAHFGQVFQDIRQSHEILATGIQKLSQQFDVQCRKLSDELSVVRHEVNALQYTIGDNFKDLYLREILNHLDMYDLISQVGINEQIHIEAVFTSLLTWVLIKSKDRASNGYDLVAQNTTQKKHLLLHSILRKDHAELAILGAIEAYLRAEGLGEDFGLDEMANLPIWLDAMYAINDLLTSFHEQLAPKFNIAQIANLLIERTNEIKQTLIKFSTNNILLRFLADKLTNQYYSLTASIGNPQNLAAMQDLLSDFQSVQTKLFTTPQIKHSLQNSTAYIQTQLENNKISVSIDASEIFLKMVYEKIAHDLGITSYLHTINCQITIPNGDNGIDDFTNYLNAEIGPHQILADQVILLPLRLAYEFSVTINNQKFIFATVTGTTYPGGPRLRHEIYQSWYNNMPGLCTYLAVNTAGYLITWDNDHAVRTSMLHNKKPTDKQNPVLEKLLQKMHEELITQKIEHFTIHITNSQTIADIPPELLINRDRTIKASMYNQRVKLAESLGKEIFNNEDLQKASLYTKILNIMLSLRGLELRAPDLLAEFSKLIIGLNNDREITQNFKMILKNLQPATSEQILAQEPNFQSSELLQQLDNYVTEYKIMYDNLSSPYTQLSLAN